MYFLNFGISSFRYSYVPKLPTHRAVIHVMCVFNSTKRYYLNHIVLTTMLPRNTINQWYRLVIKERLQTYGTLKFCLNVDISCVLRRTNRAFITLPFGAGFLPVLFINIQFMEVNEKEWYFITLQYVSEKRRLTSIRRRQRWPKPMTTLFSYYFRYEL